MRFLKSLFKLSPIFLVVLFAKFLEILLPLILGLFFQNVFALKYISYGVAIVIGIFLLHAMQVLWVQKKVHDWTLGKRQSYLNKLMHAPFSFYSQKSNATLFTKLFSDLEFLGDAISHSMVAFLSHITLLTGIILALLWIDTAVAIPLYALFAAVTLSVFIYRRKQKSQTLKMKDRERKLYAQIYEYFDAREEVRSFAAVEHLLDKIRANHRSIEKRYQKLSHDRAWFLASIDGAKTLFLVICFLSLSLIYKDAFPLGKFFSLSLYALIFFRPLVHLLEHLESLNGSLRSFAKLRLFFDKLPLELIPKAPFASIDSIELNEVVAKRSVSWNGSSFSFEKGNAYILTGEVGYGKSSFIDAFLGFLDMEGKLYINGTEYPINFLKAIRPMVSVVFQNQKSSLLPKKDLLQELSRKGHALKCLTHELTSKARVNFVSAATKKASIYIFDEAIPSNDHLLYAAWKEFYHLKKKEAIFIVTSHNEKPLLALDQKRTFSLLGK